MVAGQPEQVEAEELQLRRGPRRRADPHRDRRGAGRDRQRRRDHLEVDVGHVGRLYEVAYLLESGQGEPGELPVEDRIPGADDFHPYRPSCKSWREPAGLACRELTVRSQDPLADKVADLLVVETEP